MTAFPTTIEPTFSDTTKVTKTRVKRIQFGDGYTQRSAEGINVIVQEWSLGWIGTAAEITEMEAFLEARGGYEDFTWTPKGEVSSRKFTCQEWTRSFASDSIHRLTAKFIEEFDLN